MNLPHLKHRAARLSCAMATLLMFGLSGAAFADDLCPQWTQTLPGSVSGREQALATLQTHAVACARNADWHAQRGALLLALGRYAEAAASLERALFLAPEHAAARIDYADALAALGDLESARSLAQQLLSIADIPPAARDHLTSRLAHWQVSASPWARQLQFGLSAGWESNLNGGPAADSIWITLPEGTFNLPLAASERPRAGLTQLHDLGLAATRAVGADGRLLVRTQWRFRDAPGRRFDYVIAQGDVSRFAPSALGGEWMVQAAHLEQALGGRRLFAETRLLAQQEWALLPCAPRLAGDYALRRYATASILDGVQTGVRAAFQCATGPWRFHGELRAARDRSRQALRPGGDQRWTEARMMAGWQDSRRRFEIEAGVARVADASGYSPLLDNGSRRRVRRQTVRLELGHRLDTHWELAFGIEAFRQRSNLALFGFDNHGLYFGARYRR